MGETTMKTRGNWSFLLLVLVGLSAVGGCSPDPGRLEAFLQTPRRPVVGMDYVVLPPDVLSISSIYVTEIDGRAVRIGPDGKIVLPLLGDIYVAEMTTKQIEEVISKAASEYYKKTDVTVEVAAYNSQKFYVFGQVGRPGPVPWTGCDTVLDVLATHAPTQLAWPERIKVIRARQPLRGGFLPPPELDELDSDGQRLEKSGRKGAKESEYVVVGRNKTGPVKVLRSTKEGREDSEGSEPGEQLESVEEPVAELGVESSEGESAEEMTGADEVVAEERLRSKEEVEEEYLASGKNEFGADEVLINLTSMIQTGDLSHNILLQPGDVIYVPPNHFAAVGLALRRVLFPVSPVLETVRLPKAVEGAADTNRN